MYPRIIFFISFCLWPYFLNASVIVIDYNKEMEEVLADFNITDPTPEQKQFARRIVDERIEKEKYRYEKEKYHRYEKEKYRYEKEKEDYENRINNLTKTISEKDRTLGGLEKDKDTLNEDRFFVVTRQVIDNAEENFPQPQDSDWQTKGVKYDKTKLQGKVGWDLFQERRRQKWKYYLDNPPNDFMRELAKKVADKDTFADGVALAYRLLSDKFHKGFHLTIFKDPAQFFIYQRVVDALRILLEKEGILKIYVDQLKLTTPPK